MKLMRIGPLLIILASFGCHRKTYPLLPPSDVESITGDNKVTLLWTDVDNPNVVSYRIYRSTSPDGYFELIDEVSTNSYVDQDVENGITYYYALSSVDRFGNESDLTQYPIFDTPRPERHGQRVFAYSYSHDTMGYSGYLLAEFSNVNKDSGDFYFTYKNATPTIVCAPSTYIQDLGKTDDLTDINWAPENGWNETEKTAYKGHSYVIWTQDNHFAQIRVSEITNEYMLFDVAYQTDPANHELSIEKNKNTHFEKTRR